MIELKKYQCEHCRTVYDVKDYARKCEIQHIQHNELQIVRAIHGKCHPVELDEGKWPEFIIVGKNEIQDKLYRYKFDGEEITTGPFMADSFYNPDNK